MKLCDDCGGALELTCTRGNLEFFRCKSCGKEYVVHFSLGPNDFSVMEESAVEVVLAWERGQPSLKDVLKLRNLAPDFRDISKESIASKIQNGEFSLGLYFESQADDLVEKLRNAGLPAHSKRP